MSKALILVYALMAGLLANRITLPPLIGYLAVGFFIGTQPGLADVDFQLLSDLGVTLLLFSIGLKLDIRLLLRPHVWAVTLGQMALSISLVVALLVVLKLWGWSLLAGMLAPQMLTIAFALSFSSTVFAVKVLEQQGELASFHGRIAIGILVLQDIIAVIYLSALTGKLPSPWAALVLLAIPLRGLIEQLLRRCGHGELLVLAGFALAFSGAALFDSVGLKGDLGALYFGALLAGYGKANELSKALLQFKDFLLLGFFLSIGQNGLPDSNAWVMAGLLTVVLLGRPLWYTAMLCACRVTARTSLLAGLSLNNYSEFGLIVLAMASGSGVIGGEWLVILALALSISFVMGSAIEMRGNRIYQTLYPLLRRLERRERLPEQAPIDPGNVRILVLGMGRVGTGAYEYLHELYGNVVTGIEESPATLRRHHDAGRHVIPGDASDKELWVRLCNKQVSLMILALSNHKETLRVVRLLRDQNYTGAIGAVAKYPDEVDELRELNVVAFNFYAEAGKGFAEHVVERLEALDQLPDEFSLEPREPA